MGTLLGHIGKDKQADALVDKVLARFQGPGVLARNLVFCLNQVLSDLIFPAAPLKPPFRQLL